MDGTGTISSWDGLEARKEIFRIAAAYPADEETRERSAALFLRGSLLARILAVGEIYQRIVPLPGVILDVGTARGETAVLCENFRAIHEPLNLHRRIASFGSFEGCEGLSADGVPGGSYASLLERLLGLHERANALGHVTGKHAVYEGDCVDNLDWFFSSRSNEFVALAFFEALGQMAMQEAFEKVWARVVPGGIVAFWQLTQPLLPAEGSAYVEGILGKVPHALRRSQFYPGLCYLVKP